MFRSDRTSLLDRPAAIGLVLVALLERVLLGVLVAPIAVLLIPPLVPVVCFVVLQPALQCARHGENDWKGRLETSVPGRFPHAVLTSAIVHAVAVAVGVTLFLLVDTPTRYLWYWAGGEAFSIPVMALAALSGVVAGMVLTWSVLGVAVVRVNDGVSIRESLWSALARPLATPRAVTADVLVDLGAMAVVALGMGVTYYLWWVGVGWASVLVALCVAVVSFVVLTSAVSVQLSRVERPLLAATVDRRTVTAVSVTLLLVTSLVAVAGAVRVTETRPMDTEPEPLPDDPSEAYAVAFENTERVGFVLDKEVNRDIHTYDELHYDPENRRFVMVTEDAVSPVPSYYLSAGSADPQVEDALRTFALETWQGHEQTQQESHAVPGYWYVTDSWPVLARVLPEPNADEWTERNRTDDEVTIEATGEAVLGVLWNEDSDVFDADIEEAWIRMTIDIDRAVIEGGEYRLWTVDPEDGTTETDIHETYDLETDVHVDRPAEHGEPRSSEWLWKLVAY